MSESHLTANQSCGKKPVFSQHLLDRYEVLSMLGEGTYGMVYKCRERTTGRLEAVKLLRYDEDCERFALAPNVVREISILKRCRHPNIIKLHDILINPPNHISLHFELMKSDLRKYIHDRVVRERQVRGTTSRPYGLPMEQIKKFTLQILLAIRVSHCQNIVHRDMKPQNILVSEDESTVKIGDWGLSRQVKPRHSHALLTREVVTLWYRSPELLLGCQRYDRSVDMWSIGVIVYHMVTGMPLVHCPTAITTLISIFHIFGTPKDPWLQAQPFYSHDFPQWESEHPRVVLKELTSCHPDSSDELCDFLARLLTLNPTHRSSARKAIWHGFLDDVRAEYVASEKSKMKETNKSCKAHLIANYS